MDVNGFDSRWAVGSVDFAEKARLAAAGRAGERRALTRHRVGTLCALLTLAGFTLLAVNLLPDRLLPWHHGGSDNQNAGPAYSVSAKGVQVPGSFPLNHLSIPTQADLAPIEKSGVNAAGYVFVPQDVHHVGVFTKAGPLDGSVGDVVIVGHVNWIGQGAGYLSQLKNLTKGAIVVTRGSGRPQAWQVTSVKSYSKAKGLPQDIFRARGSRVLTMITCGGTLNTRTHSYDNNIVVTAEPVPTVVTG